MRVSVGWLADFFALFYPRLCYACQKALVQQEECICSFCNFHLPRTHMYKERENSLSRVFWGRADIETATALFYFQKGGRVQKLIHQFKYRGKKDVGMYLGRMLGSELNGSELWQPVDMIMPVPMHARKQHERGFNQSEVIARGIAETFHRPLELSNLVKTEKTETQTRKTRFRRWENVETVFSIVKPERLRSKNILLVDDVITTGSTLEACTQKIKEIPGTRVWLVSLAMTV